MWTIARALLLSSLSTALVVACSASDSAPGPLGKRTPTATPTTTQTTPMPQPTGTVPPAGDDAGPKDAGQADAASAQNDELYFGSCLSELALGNLNKTFSFYTKVSFAPTGTGGEVTMTLRALAVGGAPVKPPPNVAMAGIVGAEAKPPKATTDANKSFSLTLGTFLIVGAANPISGSDVQIDTAGMKGRFAKAKFCLRLSGDVIKPVAAARSLDPTKNFCVFVPVTEGAATPTFTAADYSEASCPL